MSLGALLLIDKKFRSGARGVDIGSRSYLAISSLCNFTIRRGKRPRASTISNHEDQASVWRRGSSWLIEAKIFYQALLHLSKVCLLSCCAATLNQSICRRPLSDTIAPTLEP